MMRLERVTSPKNSKGKTKTKSASAPTIFDIGISYSDSLVTYLPTPWEATTSYHQGTAQGPAAILKASAQLDLFDLDLGSVEKAKPHCLPVSIAIEKLSAKARTSAKTGKTKAVNEASDEFNEWVYKNAKKILLDGKYLGVIGGDHSAPFGAFQAIAEKEKNFGILHVDAHFDLRKAYQGFRHSHASIMYNVAEEISQASHFVQVGIRDFCKEEFDYAQSQPERFTTFFDSALKRRTLSGENWYAIARSIVAPLPEKVWVSFDIDGLDPQFCPHTGTPVPGGLSFDQALLILEVLASSGRTIIGFDLCEVAPGKDSDWDANVGMRLLWKITGWMLRSQKHLSEALLS